MAKPDRRPSTGSLADHRIERHCPGCKCRDPARPECDIPRSIGAWGTDAICVDRWQRGDHNRLNRATRAGEPVASARNQSSRIQARASVRRAFSDCGRLNETAIACRCSMRPIIALARTSGGSASTVITSTTSYLANCAIIRGLRARGSRPCIVMTGMSCARSATWRRSSPRSATDARSRPATGRRSRPSASSRGPDNGDGEKAAPAGQAAMGLVAASQRQSFRGRGWAQV